MEYGDENAIAIRREALRQSKWDISLEVEIDDVSYTFAERILQNQKISIILPEQFDVMRPEIAKLKYPSEYRPDMILTSPKKGVDFTLKYILYEDVSPEEIEEFTENLRMAGKRMNPATIYETVGKIKAVNTFVPYYACQTSAFDADLYCITFTSSIDGHLLLGGFSCIYEEREPWIILVKQMLETIQDLTLEEEARK